MPCSAVFHSPLSSTGAKPRFFPTTNAVLPMIQPPAPWIAPYLYLILWLASLSTLISSQLRGLAQTGKNRATHRTTSDGQWWERTVGPWVVPKQWYTHFYVLFATLLLMVCCSDPGAFARPIPLTMAIQAFRRLYECLYVHQWRSHSQMHAAGYVVGLLHYLYLPGCALGSDVTRVTKRPIASVVLVLAILWAQYQQHQCFRILADLRSRKSSKAIRMPQGCWFDCVVCPHMFFETLIYVGWTALAVLGKRETIDVFDWKLFVVLLWVITNQTVTALDNLRWYQARFPNEASQRHAIYPGLV